MSIIEDITLGDGVNVYVQAGSSSLLGGQRVNISFDGRASQYSHWLTLAELEELGAIIKKVLAQAELEKQKDADPTTT